MYLSLTDVFYILSQNILLLKVMSNKYIKMDTNNIYQNTQYQYQNTDKKLFCINCGKTGHNSKRCLCSIISIGIVCINIDDLDLNTIIGYSKKIQNKYLFTVDEIYKLKNLKERIDSYDIKYLLIRRKHSLNYVEFIRGKYDINNIDYIEKSINFITIHERNNIQNLDFEELWKDLWGEHVTNNSNEFIDSNDKFNLLKKGFYVKKNDNDYYLINHIPTVSTGTLGGCYSITTDNLLTIKLQNIEDNSQL